MTTPVKCTAKHTKYQPPDEDWRCPRCGATALAKSHTENTFIILDSDEESHGDCSFLHERDSLGCGCGFGTSGKAFAARLQKAANMVPCPHCKGHGLVNGSAKGGG